MRLEFCQPTLEDAVYVVEHMRQDEKLEIYSLIGDNALDDLKKAIKKSDMVGCAKFDGVPVAIYGARRMAAIADGALAWAYFTDAIDQHKVLSGRHMKKAVASLLEHYSYIYNYVPDSCEPIKQWLKSLGAKFYGPIPYGVYEAQHWYFEIRRD